MHDAHLAAAATVALPDLAFELAEPQPLLPRCWNFRLNRLEGRADLGREARRTRFRRPVCGGSIHHLSAPPSSVLVLCHTGSIAPPVRLASSTPMRVASSSLVRPKSLQPRSVQPPATSHPPPVPCQRHATTAPRRSEEKREEPKMRSRQDDLRRSGASGGRRRR